MTVIRKIVSSKAVNCVLRCFFSLFYNKKYLTGRYFNEKIMGWFWAARSLKGRMFGENKKVPWPVHPRTIVSGAERISFHPDSLNVFQVPGCYWQAIDAVITVGKNCHVAPNVGIITTNHNLYNPSLHDKGKDVVIGDSCWLGMNSVILPGVVLGEHTVVAAGAVVTKSFPEGYCVVGGTPAKIIKKLEQNSENQAKGEPGNENLGKN